MSIAVASVLTTPTLLRCALVGLVGALIAGPLVRAAAWRHAADDPPRTACPACAYAGRIAASGPFTGCCLRCRTRAGPASALPELLTGAGCAFAAALLGSSVQSLALVWFIATGTALSFVDATVHRLPDRLTAPAFIGTALLLTTAAFEDGQPSAALRLWLAAIALGAGYLVLALVAEAGLGDAKLAPSIGAMLGYFSWSDVVRGTLAAFLLGALFLTARLRAPGASRMVDLPFGPFMLLGALLALGFP